MSSLPLRVALLWHQHQPYYKQENRYLLPWARLHATKDYLDMSIALERFPLLHQTTNIVPSLLVQLVDYVEHGATDVVLELSRKPASELTDDDKLTMLRYFFLCNVERMIMPYPRYAELYHKAGSDPRGELGRLRASAASFHERDWRDLQVWYNLVWIGPWSNAEEPFASLLARGHDFTEDEKHRLLDASIALIAEVIPTYRRLRDSGQLELSVTPFYHPILPILCDDHAAIEALPSIELPRHRVCWPEDARAQVQRAIDLFESHFGERPQGMWPSEGSVSDRAIEEIAASGLTWAATDEEILRRSLGEAWSPLKKYFPWTLRTRAGDVRLLFRDHQLSDAIGFVYSGMSPHEAAADFYHRLVEIRGNIVEELGAAALEQAVVPVILDGENCWEYYVDNGRPFLELLYRLLGDSAEITTVTISEALAAAPPSRERTLGHVYSGSWIGADFRIWIGGDEDNAAWDALSLARRAVLAARDRVDADTHARAMEEIYIAEGSDWYWWFGDEHTTINQDDFDVLFRYHIRCAYEILGEPVPKELDVPIRRAMRTPAVVAPTRALTPAIDGRRSDHEWNGAGYFVVERVGGAMHRADAFQRRIMFGSDDSHVFLRFDTTMPLSETEKISLEIAGERSVVVEFRRDTVAVSVAVAPDGTVDLSEITAAVGETLEVAVPHWLLAPAARKLDVVAICCEISEHGHPTERFPHTGVVSCPLTPNFSFD